MGQLGNNTVTYSDVPVDIPILANTIMEVSAGYYHTCAVTKSGGIKCWGDNLFGQLGDGNGGDMSLTKIPPVDVVGFIGSPAAISAGGHHSCGLTTTGDVQCWGDNSLGQVGNGLAGYSTTPVSVLW
jgi:alpha-tubulin suppressor-like RCC1 family protein